MDYYAPIQDTIAPAVLTEVSQRWHPYRTTGGQVFVEVSSNRAQSGPSSDMRGHKANYVILDGPAMAGLERLRTFRSFPDSWDGERGQRPDPKAVDFATKIFSLVALHHTPTVSLNSSGHPVLLFSGAHRGEIAVTSDSTIDYYFDGETAPFGDEVVFDGQLPGDLVAYLSA